MFLMSLSVPTSQCRYQHHMMQAALLRVPVHSRGSTAQLASCDAGTKTVM